MTAGKAILTKTLDLAAEVSGANLKSYRGPGGPQTSVSGGGPGQRPARGAHRGPPGRRPLDGGWSRKAHKGGS